MNESIFEGNLFGNGSIAGTPADEDVEEFIDIPEADDESSSEGDTPGGNILELLSRMRGLMPNSDGDEDMDDNDMDSDDYHNKAVDRARRGRNREATDICMEGLKKFPLNVDLLADTMLRQNTTVLKMLHLCWSMFLISGTRQQRSERTGAGIA